MIPLTLTAKVYDCFMFDQEFEVLEIRLHEMGPYVDHFVLVEWNRTHRTGELKPHHFDLNKERFKEFLPKIIHIKLDEELDTQDGWTRENWHRNQIMRGLTQCKPDDIILISDADEMIPGKFIPELDALLNKFGEYGFWQRLYRWYLNRDARMKWSGTCALKYKNLVKTTPQSMRNRFRAEPNVPRKHIGWHFTSMGGFEKCIYKYHNIVEGFDRPCTYEEWYAHVQNDTELLQIDESYPEWVQQNMDYLIENNMIDDSNE
jgi:beta-1,4-mannosyl-glycoprotein beta-1,4-N-acetylglucosaminyltransferase